MPIPLHGWAFFLPGRMEVACFIFILIRLEYGK